MNNLYLSFEEKLNIIDENNQIDKALKAISICEEYLCILKKHIEENPFKTKEEEIYFFKFIKPKFLAKLIFYTKWHNIQIRKITFNNKTSVKYYEKEFKKLKRFLKENIEFQTYLNANQTHFDEQFFIRNNNNFISYVEPLYITLDKSFNTTHDYLTAQISAYDMLMKKLQEEICKLSKKINNQSISQYKWSDKKVDLVELIYAIYTANSINRGKIEISELAEIFSEMFNEDLGNIYRIYAEIKNRKNPTRYIDHLKEKLLEKIDDELGN
ncbi:RteC domain-containing protein [Emticicia sp. SJ17W-69]|uniref:RteC domain-containing protein n=1 Tax=Emticicia sp. SJ17W-69 TaxID=3421657 RepID=UPI003EC07C92